MLVKERVERQMDQFFEVRLNEYEIDYLVRMLDDWATDPLIPRFPYAGLRDSVDGVMLVNRTSVYAITNCLDAEENFGTIYEKFSSVSNKVLPS